MRHMTWAVLILAIPVAVATDISRAADANQQRLSQEAFEAANPNYYGEVPFDSDADNSVRIYWKLFHAVRTDSVLAATYRSLGVRSDRGVPHLTRTAAGSKSVSSLRAEAPYQSHSETEIRQTIAQDYARFSDADRDKLVALFVAADRSLGELSTAMQGVGGDDARLLQYAYERAMLAQRVFNLEVKLRVADAAHAAQILATLDTSALAAVDAAA